MTEQEHSAAAAAPAPARVYLGGYTPEMGRSRGVEGLTWDAAGDGPVRVDELGAADLSNPTYVIAHPELPLLYAVTETTPSAVHALAIADDGFLSRQGGTELSGEGACYLDFDATGRYLLIAHYVDGSVSAVPVGRDGSLGREGGFLRFSGSGPDPERQDRAHAHQVLDHDGVVYVPDLGSDVIRALRLDPEGDFHADAEPIPLPAGSGPRHLVIDGDHLIVACELSGRLWLARRDPAGWREVHSVATSATEGDNFPSALRLAGDQVFVANRGPDTFAVFTLDRDADRLVPVTEVSTGGAWPRDLVVSDTRVWIANQNDDTLSVFTRPARPSEHWALEFQIATPSPACIVHRGDEAELHDDEDADDEKKKGSE